MLIISKVIKLITLGQTLISPEIFFFEPHPKLVSEAGESALGLLLMLVVG